MSFIVVTGIYGALCFALGLILGSRYHALQGIDGLLRDW